MNNQDLWKAENGCMVEFCNISIHKCKGIFYIPGDNKFAKIGFTGLLNNNKRSKTKVSFIAEFCKKWNQNEDRFTCAATIEIISDIMILDYIVYKKDAKQNPSQLLLDAKQVRLSKVKLNTNSLLKSIE